MDEVNKYLEKGVVPNNNTQIFKEVDYCFKKYNLKPSIYISYERYSYCGKDNKDFRITFDTNILSREYDLTLDKGDYGTSLLDENMYIMEVKCIGGMPIWFSNILAEMKIYPISFSKYGKIYQKNLKEEKIS